MRCNAMQICGGMRMPFREWYMHNVTIHWFGYGLIANRAMCARGLQNRETRAQTERRRGKPYASTKNRKQLCGIYSHLTLNAGDGPGIKEATDHSSGSRLLIIWKTLKSLPFFFAVSFLFFVELKMTRACPNISRPASPKSKPTGKLISETQSLARPWILFQL